MVVDAAAVTDHAPIVEDERLGRALGAETVGDTIAHWDEGKSLFFDDTFPHEVWNDTDSIRVVLFMDVLRPLPWPVALLNDLIIKIIAASPFIRDAKKNHDEWEKRMAKLWA